MATEAISVMAQVIEF